MPVGLLPGPVLQAIRDGPDDLADRVPMPADLKSLGNRAHNISGQAHAPLGVLSVVGRRARVSVAKKRDFLVTDSFSDACEQDRRRHRSFSEI